MRKFWDSLKARQISPFVLAAYMAVVVVFVVAFARYYIPGKGFSYLVSFGGLQTRPTVSALKDVDYYVQADSYGYDAQYYVQIAMDPSLRDADLVEAVDNLPYRARRILISAISYVLGWGEPVSILQAYVLQNAIAWLLLAGILLRWFPPSSWSNWLRWSGVLFSFGMCVSVRNSLVDGPSLVLVAAGVFLVEKNRPWLAAAVLGIAGLGKETNLLGGSALARVEDLQAPRRWPVMALRGLLVAVPLALWLWYIQSAVGPAAEAGARNFALPFAGWWEKVQVVWQEALAPRTWDIAVLQNGTFWSILMLIALTVQFLFLVLRPQWRQAWWRVGITFAVLMVFLGDAVWEGFPGAASRVLLPMQLAFNALVPMSRRWWPVLVLGNLTLLSAPAALQPPPGNGYELKGADNLVRSAESGRLRITFSPEWHETERYRDRYWRWSRGPAEITITNSQAFPLEAELDFIVSSLQERELTLVGPQDEELWRGQIRDAVTRVNLPLIRLEPGKTVLKFQTADDLDATTHDPRRLSFCLKDCVIRLRPGPIDGVAITGPVSVIGPPDVPRIAVKFGDGWFNTERTALQYWRWTQGPAELVVVNRNDAAVSGALHFAIHAISKRNVVLANADGQVLWGAEVSSKHSETGRVTGLRFEPGETRFFLRSDMPASGADNDTRLLDMIVKDLVLEAGP
ncbi:MAG: hypothetical protein R3F03_09435 [Opitutaceae bacterium]